METISWFIKKQQLQYKEPQNPHTPTHRPAAVTTKQQLEVSAVLIRVDNL